MSKRDAARVQRIANLLDARWRVPGTRVRIGLDGLLGLIPGVGDVAGAALSLWMLFEARRMGANWLTALRMTLNILIDLAVGAIPVLGDVFDVFWKANSRNLRILQSSAARQSASAKPMSQSTRTVRS